MAKSNKPELVIDRRTSKDDRRKESLPIAAERRKVPRRRQIDPTTCERDYSDDEIEFMQALDAYKRTSGRMFPTCSEILEVIRGLGYVRVTSSTPSATENSQQNSAATSETIAS